MVKWGDGQSLAICQLCFKKLTDLPVPEPYCAYYELPPGDLPLMPDKVDAATEDTATADMQSPQKSAVRAAWDWLWNL